MLPAVVVDAIGSTVWSLSTEWRFRVISGLLCMSCLMLIYARWAWKVKPRLSTKEKKQLEAGKMVS